MIGMELWTYRSEPINGDRDSASHRAKSENRFKLTIVRSESLTYETIVESCFSTLVLKSCSAVAIRSFELIVFEWYVTHPTPGKTVILRSSSFIHILHSTSPLKPNTKWSKPQMQQPRRPPGILARFFSDKMPIAKADFGYTLGCPAECISGRGDPVD
jgi:hypothetical protein